MPLEPNTDSQNTQYQCCSSISPMVRQELPRNTHSCLLRLLPIQQTHHAPLKRTRCLFMVPLADCVRALSISAFLTEYSGYVLQNKSLTCVRISCLASLFGLIHCILMSSPSPFCAQKIICSFSASARTGLPVVQSKCRSTSALMSALISISISSE